MSRPLGFSIHIFIPSGDPDALRIIEKSNWTGKGITFPRSLWPEASKRSELDKTGVYVLWGPGESGQLPRAYVGEGDPVLPRLKDHIKNKDFWTHDIAFISKDQNLNKAYVQHIESQLISLATGARRCELDNATLPQLPSLSEADRADAEGFLADILLCLPVLGVSFFETPKTTGPKGRELVLKAKGIEAQGVDTAQGFVVRAGSTAVGSEAPSIHPYLTDLRRILAEKGVLEPRGDGYRLTQDYTFASPSTAAGVLLGRSANGRIEWKDAKGRTLKDIQGEGVGLG